MTPPAQWLLASLALFAMVPAAGSGGPRAVDVAVPLDIHEKVLRYRVPGDDRAVLRVTLRAEFLDARYDERTRNGLEEGIVL